MKLLRLDFLWSHLDELGAFREPGRTPQAAREAAGLVPGDGAWFDECLRIFQAEGYTPRPRPIEQLWREWEAQKPAWRDNPGLAPTLLLVETTLRAFPDILTGRRT